MEVEQNGLFHFFPVPFCFLPTPRGEHLSDVVYHWCGQFCYKVMALWAILKLINSKPVSHTKFHWLSTAILPCNRIVTFASEQSFAMPFLLAIAPLPSTSLVVMGAQWPRMCCKHHMFDSLANCVREQMERAKNGNGHFIWTDRNGSCTLIEQGLNRNRMGTAVPLHGRNVGTFYWRLPYAYRVISTGVLYKVPLAYRFKTHCETQTVLLLSLECLSRVETLPTKGKIRIQLEWQGICSINFALAVLSSSHSVAMQPWARVAMKGLKCHSNLFQATSCVWN